MLPEGALDTAASISSRGRSLKYRNSNWPSHGLKSCRANAFQPFIHRMGPAHDVDALCLGDQLQRDLERSLEVRND